MKKNNIPRNEYIRKPVGKTNPYKQDVIYDPMGQWKYPGQVTKIPSNQITMQGVNYPVYGEDNLGYGQMMYPGANYTFPGQYVTEIPMAQKGGPSKDIKDLQTLPEFNVISAVPGSEYEKTLEYLQNLEEYAGNGYYNLWNKAGTPHIDLLSDKKERPNFNPFTNTMKVLDMATKYKNYPFYPELKYGVTNNDIIIEPDEFISELAHAKQLKNAGLLNFVGRAALDWFKSPYFTAYGMYNKPSQYEKGVLWGEGQYETPGTIEYEAHKEIEPALSKELYDNLGKQTNYKIDVVKKRKGGISKAQKGYNVIPNIEFKQGVGSQYDPVLETIMIDEDDYKHADLDELLRHELWHHYQNYNNWLRLPEEFPTMQRPQTPATDEVLQNYYNRRKSDVEELTKGFKQRYPEFTFVPDQLIHDKEVENVQYTQPWTMEGEGRLAETWKGMEDLYRQGYNVDDFVKNFYIPLVNKITSEKKRYGGDPSLPDLTGHYQKGGNWTYEADLISKVLMNRNKDKDFVKRAYDIGTYPDSDMFTIPDDNEFGKRNSHLMEWGTDDSGQAWMYPSIMNSTNEAIKIPNQYADYISSEGYKKATGMIPEKPFGGQNTKTHTHMKEGGWLDEYQKGGRSPIYLTDANDPRIRAYNDSLAAYNLSKKNEALFNKNPGDPLVAQYNKQGADLTKRTGIQPVSVKGSLGWTQPYRKENLAQIEDAWIAKFKKPVQPYIYRKEEEEKPKQDNIIYVDDKNDPRYKAYSDSSNLYNYSILQAKNYFNEPNPNKYNRYNQREAVEHMNLDKSMYKSLSNSSSDVYGNKISDLQKRTGYLPIGQRYLGEGSNYIFKKPVQEVKVREQPKEKAEYMQSRPVSMPTMSPEEMTITGRIKTPSTFVKQKFDPVTRRYYPYLVEGWNTPAEQGQRIYNRDIPSGGFATPEGFVPQFKPTEDKPYNYWETDNKKKVVKKKQNGGWLDSYQVGGNKASYSDSLNVYNKAIELQKFYNKLADKYENPTIDRDPAELKINKEYVFDDERFKKKVLAHRQLKEENKKIIEENKDPNISLYSDLIIGAIDPNAPLAIWDKRIDPQGIIRYMPKQITEYKNLLDNVYDVLKKTNANEDYYGKFILDPDKKSKYGELSYETFLMDNPQYVELAAKKLKKSPEAIRSAAQIRSNLQKKQSQEVPGAATEIAYYDPIAVKPWADMTSEERKERIKKYGVKGTPLMKPSKDQSEQVVQRETPQYMEMRQVSMPITPQEEMTVKGKIKVPPTYIKQGFDPVNRVYYPYLVEDINTPAEKGRRIYNRFFPSSGRTPVPDYFIPQFEPTEDEAYNYWESGNKKKVVDQKKTGGWLDSYQDKGEVNFAPENWNKKYGKTAANQPKLIAPNFPKSEQEARARLEKEDRAKVINYQDRIDYYTKRGMPLNEAVTAVRMADRQMNRPDELKEYIPKSTTQKALQIAMNPVDAFKQYNKYGYVADNYSESDLFSPTGILNLGYQALTAPGQIASLTNAGYNLPKDIAQGNYLSAAGNLLDVVPGVSGAILSDLPGRAGKLYNKVATNKAPLSDQAQRLKDLKYAKDWAKKYGYKLPKNLKRISESEALTNKTIKGLVNRHNTFVRGISTNWDIIGAEHPEVLEHLTSVGIDWKNNPKAAAEYMATHIPGETGYGRHGLKPGENAIYISNSMPTAEGYTYGQGYKVKVKRPTDFSASDRKEWIKQNDFDVIKDFEGSPFGEGMVKSDYIKRIPTSMRDLVMAQRDPNKMNKLQQLVLDSENKALDKLHTFSRKYKNKRQQLRVNTDPDYRRNMILWEDEEAKLKNSANLLDKTKLKYYDAMLKLGQLRADAKPFMTFFRHSLGDIDTWKNLSKNLFAKNLDPFSHYTIKGIPGQKVLEPIQSIEVTPDIWKNTSRAHVNTYTPKLSRKENGGWLDKYQPGGINMPSETTQSLVPAYMKYLPKTVKEAEKKQAAIKKGEEIQKNLKEQFYREEMEKLGASPIALGRAAALGVNPLEAKQLIEKQNKQYAKEAAEQRLEEELRPVDDQYILEKAIDYGTMLAGPEMFELSALAKQGAKKLAGKLLKKGSKVIDTPRNLKIVKPKDLVEGKVEGLGSSTDVSINPDVKTLRDPRTGEIVYQLEKEDYDFGNDWETIAPEDFRNAANTWINKFYSTSGGYTDVPSFNKQLNDLITRAQFGKRPMEKSISEKLRKATGKKPLQTVFDPKHMDLWGYDDFPMYDKYGELNIFVVDPETQGLSKMIPFTGKDAWNMPYESFRRLITPNKYGGERRGWLDNMD